MNENFVKEAVAAGLRAMSNPPDAFLFIDTGDWTWSKPVILGLQVYHSYSLYCSTWQSNNHASMFIPIWHSEFNAQLVDRARFAEAYNDAISIWEGK